MPALHYCGRPRCQSVPASDGYQRINEPSPHTAILCSRPTLPSHGAMTMPGLILVAVALLLLSACAGPKIAGSDPGGVRPICRDGCGDEDRLRTCERALGVDEPAL